MEQMHSKVAKSEMYLEARVSCFVCGNLMGSTEVQTPHLDRSHVLTD